MLDDLKYIHERDAQDALGIAEKQWQQYQYSFEFGWQPPREINQVVVAGMGGSALAAEVLRSWPGLPVPFEIVKNYTLPAYVNENTLVICSSYSGNTEETLAAFDDAVARDSRPMLITVASGGALRERAAAADVPFIELPSGYQPRMTLGYQWRALVEIVEQVGLGQGKTDELSAAADWLKDQMTDWTAIVPVSRNPVKQLAQELMGRSPVVYAGPLLTPAAYKWKISFNENAKNVAWYNVLPEFNHNEFLGWTSHPVDKPYAVIDLRSEFEHPRVQKRFEVTDRLLSGQRPAAHVINAQGETLIQQLLWVIAYGDFVSLYLALINGLNPTPVDLIEKLKAELAK